MSIVCGYTISFNGCLHKYIIYTEGRYFYMNEGSRKLVKCVVCGDIFDASLDTCPVCGVGREFFVPYEEEIINFKNNTDEKFVILGNGAAGLNAAYGIRQRNATCSIVIISEEGIFSYNRPMLTKSLLQEMEKNDILIHQKEWYLEKDMINILNSVITNINVKEKYVEFDNGKQIIYDKLIYALGAKCFVPPIIGKDKNEVITIRSFADVIKIRELMPKVKSVVVIGGGVLGLEAALSFSSFGVKVTVLEVADKLMVRQLDDDAGEIMKEIIKKSGINIYVKANISEIIGDDKVRGIKLLDGQIIDCDMVIISCGIKPNVDIGKEAGIQINRSILVNEKMETNIKDIYACGDCAEFLGENYALWTEAVEMGKVAGANAAGDDVSYKLVPAALTFHGMDVGLFSIGDNGKKDSVAYTTKEIRNDMPLQYEKYYFVENKLVGVILIGDTTKMNDLSTAVTEKWEYDRLFKESH